MTELQNCGKLYVKLIKYPTEEDWLLVKQTALMTIHKISNIPPDSVWKSRILASEHSPIRELNYMWEWVNLPSWVSVHLVRHHIGVQPYVSSQRNDKQSAYDRKKAPQDAPVTHRASANAQAIINISRKRLCNCASPETADAWQMLVDKLATVTPELACQCVPNCVYRGGICTEFNSCHFNRTNAFKIELEKYIQNMRINDN